MKSVTLQTLNICLYVQRHSKSQIFFKLSFTLLQVPFPALHIFLGLYLKFFRKVKEEFNLLKSFTKNEKKYNRIEKVVSIGISPEPAKLTNFQINNEIMQNEIRHITDGNILQTKNAPRHKRAINPMRGVSHFYTIGYFQGV